MDIHYREDDEDCMGNRILPYWQCSMTCSDGSVKIANGPTQDDAIVRATLQVQEHERYLALPDFDKLKEIIEGDDLLDTKQREAIRILGKLVIDLYDDRATKRPN